MSLATSLRPLALATVTALATLPMLAVAGCGNSSDANVANVASGPMPEGESWSGVYFHPVFGYLHLEEQGSNVVGRWKRTDHTYWGEMSGTVTGNVFHYTWKEHKIGMLGAASTTSGKGYFVYKVNKENIGELDGQYGLKDAEVGSSWKGIKQVRMPPDLKSIGGGEEGGVAPAFGN